MIDGLQADVVTLALEGDINAIAEKSGLINADWRGELENNSTPYTSTIVFLVRKGNPKGILDWGDLIKDGVEVITPNPKTSGGARWNYLAAWAWANKNFGGDEAKNAEFIKQLYAPRSGARYRRPRLDRDLRAEGTRRRAAGLGERGLSSCSTNSAPTISTSSIRRSRSSPNRRSPWSTRMPRRMAPPSSPRPTSNYLYSAEGQTIAASNHYRPSKPELVTDQALVAAFPNIELISIDDPLFGGWATAQPKHFGDGGIFDQIYTPLSSAVAGPSGGDCQQPPCSTPRDAGWSFVKPSVIPGFGLTFGYTLFYL